MQAFAQKAGGMLTDTQVEILVRGIRNWAKPEAFGSDKPPAYTASQPGDAARGQRSFQDVLFFLSRPGRPRCAGNCRWFLPRRWSAISICAR